MNNRLSKVQLAVLLRCLNYGAAAISTQEVANGAADVIVREVEKMRKIFSSELSNILIEEER